jgi:FkbM family methyltransferase
LSATCVADLIYDVGMHRGEDTDYYLRKGFRVVGFEADPELVRHCRQRFAAPIESGRLTLVEGAVVESPPGPAGTIRFHRNLDLSVWGTVSDDWAARNRRLGTRVETIEVPVVDFAAALARYGVPYYLKIDIEGADLACLAALRGSSARPAYVSLESEKVDHRRLMAEFDVLTSLGYDAFQLVQQESIPGSMAPLPGAEGSALDYRFENGASGPFGADLPDAWLTREEAMHRYERVFRRYRLFGDRSRLGRSGAGARLLRALSRLARKPLPGWYDTHARHGSLAEPQRR